MIVLPNRTLVFYRLLSPPTLIELIIKFHHTIYDRIPCRRHPLFASNPSAIPIPIIYMERNFVVRLVFWLVVVVVFLPLLLLLLYSPLRHVLNLPMNNINELRHR